MSIGIYLQILPITFGVYLYFFLNSRIYASNIVSIFPYFLVNLKHFCKEFATFIY
jgi:hypothetical protein